MQVVFGAETFLTAQELTFSGELITPACNISLSEDPLFRLNSHEKVQVHHQSLLLSQCDIEGIDVAFQAETWPGQAVRAVLKGIKTQRYSKAYHFRIAPDDQPMAQGGTDVVQLLPNTEIATFKSDTTIPDINPQGRYFSLDNKIYPYQLAQSGISYNGSMRLSFVISLHHDASQDTGEDMEELSGVFGLRVTYK